MIRFIVLCLLINMYTPVYGGGIDHGLNNSNALSQASQLSQLSMKGHSQSMQGQSGVESINSESNAHDCCPSKHNPSQKSPIIGSDLSKSGKPTSTLFLDSCFDCQGECGDCKNLSQLSTLFADVQYRDSAVAAQKFMTLNVHTQTAFQSFDRPPI